VHPSDSDAWKALDNFDVEFAQDARNVRIGNTPIPREEVY
jgi:hypothetical protein